MTMSPPAIWPSEDGTPVSCREKLKMLRDNHEELAQTLREARHFLSTLRRVVRAPAAFAAAWAAGADDGG